MNRAGNGISGVFWIINEDLCAYPFGSVDSTAGISKSGTNYNHQRLWEEVRPAGCCHGFNYYPRGRVEVRAKGRPIIYMNSNIRSDWIPEIKAAFSLTEEPVVHYDGSRHYRCYLDEGFCESRYK